MLRWASVGGALTADPHAYDDIQTTAQLRQVYEPLVGFDSNLDLVPQLAVAWRLVDPTTWEFELRPNVRFHDGTPFTAADVVFSFARAKTELPAGFAGRIESIAEVRAVDEHTVRIKTKFPDPQLWDKVRTIAIVSERWATAHDARVPVNVSANEENYASRHANGTGPFILEGVRAQRSRWSWCATPTGGASSATRTTSIGSSSPRSPIPSSASPRCFEGDLDLLTDPPFAALDRIKSTPGLKLAQANELRTIWLGFDQGSDRAALVRRQGQEPVQGQAGAPGDLSGDRHRGDPQDVMRGLAIPAGMLVAPGAIGYAPELDQRLPYDPEAAKRCSPRPATRTASA